MYDQDLHEEPDEYGFWANVPERRFSLPRRARAARPVEPAERTRPVPSVRRSHGGRPVDMTAGAAPGEAARSFLGHVDPLIRRSGTLALVITLFIPLAMALRSGERPQEAASLQPGVGAADGGAIDDAQGSTGAGSVADATGPAAGVGEADPFAGIDIAALPVAVPVNGDGNAEASASQSPAAPVAQSSPAELGAATPTATTLPAATARAEQARAHRATCSNTYTVARGDAWVLIAKKVGTTTKALLAANNATRRTALYPGRTVCLPKGAAVPASTPAPTTTAKPPSTTVPAAPPTTVASRPVNNYSKAQAEQIIREVWPDDLEDHAVFIAKRESHLTPNVNNYCCYGLFQIYYSVHKKWLAQIGVTSAAQLWDPRINAYAALVLYQRAGSFAPWGG